jgi:hypothetical protein
MSYENRADIKSKLKMWWQESLVAREHIFKLVTGHTPTSEAIVTCLRSMSMIDGEFRLGDRIPEKGYTKEKINSPLLFFSYITASLNYNVVQYPESMKEIIDNHREIVWSYLKTYIEPHLDHSINVIIKGKELDVDTWHTLLCCSWVVLVEIDIYLIETNKKHN